MFKKETEYALRGLVYIQTQNNNKHKPGIEEIVKEINAPKFFTAKILQKLVKQGFIESIKGKNGGFYFNSNKPNLLLSDLISNIEGNEIYTHCVFGLKHCNCNSPCPLHNQYVKIRDLTNKMLTEETIQSLALKNAQIE